MSATAIVDLGGITVAIPKALYLAAISTAIVMTCLTHLVGRLLTRVEVVRQRLEAGFRHDLGLSREHAEQVALSHGQHREQQRAAEGYRLIRKNWRRFTVTDTSMLTVLNVGQAIANFIPLFFTFPMVLSGQLKIGDVALISIAFGNIYGVMSSGSTLYSRFAILRAAALRLNFFERAYDRVEISGFDVISSEQADFSVKALSLRLPNGKLLLTMDHERFHRGERVLIQGRSGSGKSTLFRAFAGLWPFGEGQIERPAARATVMFMPQRPYLPAGTVAEVLSYPADPDSFTTLQIERVLADVKLERLAGDLETSRSWSKILSPGEQQRICLGRALLSKPDFLFLDEATSALDPQTEAEIFSTLDTELPDSAIITIAHGDRLARFHGRQIVFENGGMTRHTLHNDR